MKGRNERRERETRGGQRASGDGVFRWRDGKNPVKVAEHGAKRKDRDKSRNREEIRGKK